MIHLVSVLGCLALGSPASVTSDDLGVLSDRVIQSRKACGPSAVWYCLRRFGRTVPVGEVWDRAGITADGVSLRTLLDLLGTYGVEARGLDIDPGRLETLPVPSMLVIDARHCVVYEGMEPDGQQVRYFDPAGGRPRSYPVDGFRKHWTGEAIVFDPLPLSNRAFARTAGLAALGMLLLAITGRSLGRRRARRPAPAAVAE